MSPLLLLVISIALLVPANSQQYTQAQWTTYLQGCVDNADLTSIANTLVTQKISSPQTLALLTTSDLYMIGVSVGNGVNMLQRARSAATDASATNAPVPTANSTDNSTAAAGNSSASAVPAISTITLKIEISTGNVTVTPANSTVSNSTAAANATSSTTGAYSRRSAKRSFRPKREVMADWGTWLTGTINNTELANVAQVMSDHNVDPSQLQQLGVTGLTAVGISPDSAARMIIKAQLSDWLQGVVNAADIPSVIAVLINHKVNISALQNMSISDMAAEGVALGDCTRIWAKFHIANTPAATVGNSTVAANNATSNSTANVAATPVISITLAAADGSALPAPGRHTPFGKHLDRVIADLVHLLQPLTAAAVSSDPTQAANATAAIQQAVAEVMANLTNVLGPLANQAANVATSYQNDDYAATQTANATVSNATATADNSTVTADNSTNNATVDPVAAQLASRKRRITSSLVRKSGQPATTTSPTATATTSSTPSNLSGHHNRHLNGQQNAQRSGPSNQQSSGRPNKVIPPVRRR